VAVVAVANPWALVKPWAALVVTRRVVESGFWPARTCWVLRSDGQVGLRQFGQWAGPSKRLKILFPIFQLLQAWKIQKLHFLLSKNFQTFPGVDKFKSNNFPFRKNFKIPTEFVLKIQEAKQC
jgi:hypothetical protein